MRKLLNHAALKEWASVISALQTGEQILLLRKGGIADTSFTLESREFYLFPTYLHQKEKQFKSEGRHHFVENNMDAEPTEVTISSWAEVVDSWTIPHIDILGRLEPLFIFTHDTLEERFRFRSNQQLRLVALRVWQLQSPVVVRNRPEYAGCRSWISLDDEIDVSRSSPALEESELRTRIAEVASLLA